jgi:hypothetical protein
MEGERMTIYKFPLSSIGHNRLVVPGFQKWLHFGIDGGHTCCLWAVVDDKQALGVEFEIWVYPTGWPEDVDLLKMTHLGTTVTPTGFVWHCFEEGRCLGD